MTMTETPAKPKRGGTFTPEMRAKAAATRARNREAKAAQATQPANPPPTKPPVNQFAGLTPENCPTACNAERCVFVEKPYCAHPYKGGPQNADVSRPAVISRINEAKRILGKRKIDMRYAG